MSGDRWQSSTNSRAIIDACRPFERLKDFPMGARKPGAADGQLCADGGQ
jgi:hypothetical protein